MTARIMMVDDEPDAQELFRQNFRREIRQGVYSFEFAQSGEEALEIMRSQSPPEIVLVLSDINMPGISGIDLLERIRGNWPEVPVFMITAYGDKATESKAGGLGAQGFLSKPIDFAALKAELSQAIEQTK
jgi:CheY-like chemotaxis protein